MAAFVRFRRVPSGVDNSRDQIAVAGKPILVIELEIVGRPASLVLQGPVFGLRKIDDLGIVAERCR